MSKLDTMIIGFSNDRILQGAGGKKKISNDEFKESIKDVLLDQMDTIDPLHTAEWYVKLSKLINNL